MLRYTVTPIPITTAKSQIAQLQNSTRTMIDKALLIQAHQRTLTLQKAIEAKELAFVSALSKTLTLMIFILVIQAILLYRIFFRASKENITS